ncbi:MAG TPA: hypothetical protein VG452_03210 [Egibacteraceae bacterium]|nr:hypothetical protein [Egibacteraceae bacterium]
MNSPTPEGGPLLSVAAWVDARCCRCGVPIRRGDKLYVLDGGWPACAAGCAILAQAAGLEARRGRPRERPGDRPR